VPSPVLDQDAVIACADLVGRTGARGFQCGYLTEEGAGDWYAYAAYRGARVTVEGYPGPSEACDGLARRLLEGGRCACGKLVALSDSGAVAFASAAMADGSEWTAGQAAAAGQCRWTRMGKRWVSACGRGREEAGTDGG
jgi:hypothetical protein